MGRTRRRLRRPFETAAVRFALAAVPLLPRPALRALARTAGTLGCAADRRGRRIGLANLDTAFGNTKSAAEKRRILRGSFRTMALTFLDVIWFSRHPDKRLPRYVEFHDSALPLLCTKNQILITAHFGNWEAWGQMMALRGFPLHSIALPVKNPDVNRLLIERREVTGQTIVPRAGALKKLLGVLRGGGKAAFVVDQNTSEKDGGIPVEFFGLPVPATSAPVALAAKTGSELLIGFCAPRPGGRYCIYVTERIESPAESGEETVRRLTRHMLAAIEHEIRACPEHWLWMYKRWNTIYRPEDAARYPFYARQ